MNNNDLGTLLRESCFDEDEISTVRLVLVRARQRVKDPNALTMLSQILIGFGPNVL